MRIRESEEMYLETVLLLHRKTGHVRGIDIAAALGYSKPSVSAAVKRLTGDGYLFVGEDGGIELTEKGRQWAASVYERHQVLTELLTRIGADQELAEENACRMEHVISPELVEVIKTSLRSGELAPA